MGPTPHKEPHESALFALVALIVMGVMLVAFIQAAWETLTK